MRLAFRLCILLRNDEEEVKNLDLAMGQLESCTVEEDG